MSQKSRILNFFYSNDNFAINLKDLYAEFTDIPKPSIRRALNEIKSDLLIVGEGRGHWAINKDNFYRKILKIGASCGNKFKLIFAVTFENNETIREPELMKAIETDYPNCFAINYDYRDLYIKDQDIQFGYSQEIWTDDFKKSETWKNIRTGEEKI